MLENTEGAIKHDITEKLAKQSMQYEEKQNKNTTQYALDTTMRTLPSLCTMYAYDQKMGKTNKLKVYGSQQIKGRKQASQNLLRLPMGRVSMFAIDITMYTYM